MVLQLPGGIKGERQLKQILKPAKKRVLDEGLPEIPGASKVIAKMEKDIIGLKKKVKALESTTGKLWAQKITSEIASAHTDEESRG